jgi:hypothetical protein
VGQKWRVKVAPESAGRAKARVSPVTATSRAAASDTAECPVPVAFWQSSQEHMNMA